MKGQKQLYEVLEKLEISFEYHEHPPLNTIEDAIVHWKDYNSGRCKNIFFRNHKGNRHYLVILEHLRQLDIHDLETSSAQADFCLRQASYEIPGVEPGSVSPFGLINTLRIMFIFFH
jgi:Ala-tRNA(Pro) deacylase